MCIIIAKPAGVACPDLTVLKTCWDSNPHGAGYAFANPRKNYVHIHKGFMTWNDFINGVDFDFLRQYPAIFHFRYATHGSVSGGNCHPFPIIGNLRQTDYITDVAAVHNGVIRNIPIIKQDYSDTMCYILQRIRPFWLWCLKKHRKRMFVRKETRSRLLEETGSKWSFLYGDGKIVIVGQGVRVGGIWYSNRTFERSRFAVACR